MSSKPTCELQKLIQQIECTRNIAVWYDHASIGKHSHVMFTFQLVYSRATYNCPVGITERQLQNIVETPQTYFIGLSKPTTEAEKACGEMRLSDILTLSRDLVKNGITYKDVYRFTFGDNPVRCSETGQNKNGYYRLCSLPIHMDTFSCYSCCRAII